MNLIIAFFRSQRKLLATPGLPKQVCKKLLLVQERTGVLLITSMHTLILA